MWVGKGNPYLVHFVGGEEMAEHFDVLKKTGMLVNTIPADNPQSEIDFICLYTDKGATAEVKEHIVVEAPVESDHLPIIAEFTIHQQSK